jgi:flagellar hook-length control protein FliK
MIKPSAAFNLTQIIESLDVSTSSVEENALKPGVGGQQFSEALAAAMDQFRGESVGTKAAALSEIGKSLPLSSLSPGDTKGHLVGNTETTSLQNLVKISEKLTSKTHSMSDTQEKQGLEARSEIHVGLKLQTVRFMNGRKVLTSMVDLDDFTEMSENYTEDKYREKHEIDQEKTHNPEFKFLPQDSQLKSLPLWWEKQNIQQKDQNNDVSLAGRMAVAHSKQANINAVINKESIPASGELVIDMTKYQEDTLDPNMLALTEVIQNFQNFIHTDKFTGNFNLKEQTPELETNSAQKMVDAVKSKDVLSLSEQQMSRLREYICENLEIMNDDKFTRSFEVFTKSDLGAKALQNLAITMNGTETSNTGFMNSDLYRQPVQNLATVMDGAETETHAFMNVNFGRQAIKNPTTAINVTNTGNTYDANVEAYKPILTKQPTSGDLVKPGKTLTKGDNIVDVETHEQLNESIAQLARTESKAQPTHVKHVSTADYVLEERFTNFKPANDDPKKYIADSAKNDLNQALHVGKSTTTISGVNTPQAMAVSTEIGMSQYQVSEVDVQAQSTQTPFYARDVARPKFGEQLMSIVAKEIDVPQQDGVDSLRVEITPPDLGELEIELRKQGKDLEVRILASTEAAADAIKDNSSVLKNLLGNQDFSRVQVNVDVGKREHSGQQGQRNTKEGDKDKQLEQRIVKVRIHDGVVDTFV